MIYTEAKNRHGTYYGYYLCRGRQDGVCDLPYLPVADVEDAVADHYAGLGLPERFRQEVLEAIDSTMQSEQATIRELHDGYRDQLAKLAVREDKLLDLAEDGELPREKIRARLRQLRLDRTRAEQGLKETADTLQAGATTLAEFLELVRTPQELYRRATDVTRRDLNLVSYKKLWITEDGIQDDLKTEPMDELHQAAAAYRALHTAHSAGVNLEMATTTECAQTAGETPATAEQTRKIVVVPGHTARGNEQMTETYRLADFFRAGSSKQVLVRRAGIEPARLLVKGF
jgi:hypothetical protein